MTEDEVVGWHHQPDGHEFEQVMGVGDGQRSLTLCDDLEGQDRGSGSEVQEGGSKCILMAN